ncbi:MAG: DegT/DnrJ/EryC1/StrS family aminotransferase [Chloroflexi bacterium]|nr:DegT/DnrJ/EryC1/StrS family aminotransferase [Chloroflexota bacterium]
MKVTERPYHERIRAKETIPYYEAWLGDEELAHLRDVIENRWVSEGPKTAEFERRIAEVWGVRHAVAVANCTAGLIMSLKALGIGEGDEVIAPAFTFIATINAIRLAGATPVLVDVDARTFNIDPGQVEAAITPRTRAIVPVHLFGQPADMERVIAIAGAHGLPVVEDAAQGVGVRFLNRCVGSFGDCGCLSFFADKSITTGEGGVVLTDSDELATEIQYWKNDGRLERGVYVHYRIGYNFRVTDLQMAVGLGQLDKLDAIVERKRANEALYKRYLAGLEQVEFPYDDPRAVRVPHRVNILVDDPQGLVDALAAEGIGCRRFFHPVHLQPCYEGDFAGPFPNAERAYQRGVSLPSSPLLTGEQVAHVCEKIRGYYRRAR